MEDKSIRIDDRSEHYANTVVMSPTTYRGDVVTAYCVGASDQQRLNDEKVKQLVERFKQASTDSNFEFVFKEDALKIIRETFNWYWE
jgi:hypothetical protein